MIRANGTEEERRGIEEQLEPEYEPPSMALVHDEDGHEVDQEAWDAALDRAMGKSSSSSS